LRGKPGRPALARGDGSVISSCRRHLAVADRNQPAALRR